MGQLPGDEDNNLKMLMAMNSQLDANTQTLNRAQQDKAYTESLLAQQLSAWKSSQSSTNPQTLEQQLTHLQSQLLSLQARYTEDHPDVIKTKSDIAEVKKRLAEVNTASTSATAKQLTRPARVSRRKFASCGCRFISTKESSTQTTRDQKRLQGPDRAITRAGWR